ncbi:hypothetical protein O6H91_07G122100 [Diphasiastrum complanatum]|uniref:Uncharacterized protein n=2 Tax=Diphasiastrum complanatum TaxID=34168 RepID=A0ACC2D945_DIPCM|nr:hypothetical protein O6H91_07G114500 [Diphasiastrum complanatum]KAJ7550862.1 hypothetical protein O6H91_07G122100 [Diphasiastrum complanatum]
MNSIHMPPGFRFHPTDEELMIHYLRPKLNGRALEFDIICEMDIYKCEPWDLPEKSWLGGSDTEWYFFCVLDKKYSRGARSNRSTKCGFWKTTGKDRPVESHSKKVGMKKTLVFHEGRAPYGKRTDWVMYEYRLEDDISKKAPRDAVVLCHVSKKKKIGFIDTEEQISSPTNQDNDDVPFNEGDAMMDELLFVPPPTVLDCFSDFANSGNQLEQRVRDLLVVSKDTKMRSITTDLDTRLTTDCKPGVAFQLNKEYPFPVDGSKLKIEPESTDLFADNDEEVIKELHDSLMNMSPETEDLPDASLIESIDGFLEEDPWRLGDAMDIQGHLFWLPESGETYSPVSQSLHVAMEDLTQVETTTQLLSRNLQGEPSSLGSPLMYAPSFTQRPLSTDRFSSQPIMSSKARPLSTFSKLLDAISVQLPASATDVPPNFRVSMPQLTAASRIHQASSLSSVSVKSLLNSSLVRQGSATSSEDDWKGSHSTNVDNSSSNFMNSGRNQRNIDRSASGRLSFIVLLGAQ